MRKPGYTDRVETSKNWLAAVTIKPEADSYEI